MNDDFYSQVGCLNEVNIKYGCPRMQIFGRQRIVYEMENIFYKKINNMDETVKLLIFLDLIIFANFYFSFSFN